MNTEFFDLTNNTTLGNSKTECVGEYAISEYSLTRTSDIYGVDYEMPDYFFVYDLSGNDNVLTIYKYGSVDTKYFSYSYNGYDWTNVNTSNGNITINIPQREKVYIKGNNDALNTNQKGVRINCMYDFGVGGDIVYLINENCNTIGQYAFQELFIGSNVVESHRLKISNTNSYSHWRFFYYCNKLITTPQFCDSVSHACYSNMFYNCTALTTTPILSATTLAQYCYQNMFYGCTSLTTAPALPATTLADGCYNGMFRGCTQLSNIPASLPATTLASNCYNAMFMGCTNLTTTPTLPATTLATGCYADMFNECNHITTAPALPATIIASSCYNGMFNKCTQLSNIPATLPATTLANNCYSNMFSGCTNLTTPPTLPATTLAQYCYLNMFSGCNHMTVAPALPATALANYCYQQMFYGCTLLATAPALPATTLAPSCYSNMFYGCTHLTTAPALPATTLQQACYYYMFQGCTGLTSAPELPATTLVSQCYQYMFQGCSHLSYIKVGATAWNTSNTNQWVQGVAASGTFEKPTGVSIPTATNGIPNGWTVQEYTLPEPQPNPSLIIHNTSGESNDISILRQGSPASVTINYSTDGTNYTTFTTSSNLTVTLGVGENLYIDGVLKSSSSSAYYHITGTKAHTVEGELKSVQNYHYNRFFINDTTLTDASQLRITNASHQYCFQNTFQGCTGLVTAPALPATTLAYQSYYQMFYGCTALTTAPSLPATTLANYCYQYMFYGCTALTTAPTLPATTLASGCYQEMFRGCSSLTTAPSLPATNLAYNCYQAMFYGCTLLATAPALPATNLADSCYTSMFQNCTALTTAPALPATILYNNCYGAMFRGCTLITTPPLLHSTVLAPSCYQHMFNGCTSLGTPPTLPATTLASGCYNSMFYGCSSLTTAPSLPATNIASNCYNYMFYNCTALVNIPSVLPAATLAQNCYQYMFYGCNHITIAPDLPATTLATSCYQAMFYGCTALTTAPSILPATTLASQCYSTMFYGCSSLTTAPELPATTLTSTCYQQMFQNCTHLNYIKVGALTWNTSYTNSWVGNVASTGTFVMHPAATWNTTGTSGIPNGWTVVRDSYENYPFFIANSSGQVNTISITKTTASDPTIEVECSIDGETYFSVGSTSTTPIEITMQPDTLIYLRAEAAAWNGNHISGSASYKACGNILSLLYGDYFDISDDTFYSDVDNATFHRLFYNDTMLIECKNLILPENTKANCYDSMFFGCSSITAAPKLPATTMTQQCYQSMFRGCSSLATAPELPATTLANNCYTYMFYGCTSLTVAPTLEATTLYTGCYNYMFYGCSLLNKIVILNLSTAPSTTYTNNWVNGVSSTGKFYKHPDANWTTGVSGIPTGWTVKTELKNFDTLFSQVNAAYPNKLKWIHQNYSVNDDELCYITVESGMSRTTNKTLIVGDTTGILLTKPVTVSGWGAYTGHNTFAYKGYFGFVGRTNDDYGSSCYLSLFKYENNQITELITNTSVNTGNWSDMSLSCYTFNNKDYVQSVSNSSRQTLWHYNLTDRTFYRSEMSNKRVAGCMIEQNGNNLMYLIAATGNESSEGLRVNQMSSISTPTLNAVSNVLDGWNGRQYRKTPNAFGDEDFKYLVRVDGDGWYEVTISADYTTISIGRAYDLLSPSDGHFQNDFMLIDGEMYGYNTTTTDIEKIV